jgi:hypothetical protein
LCPEAARGRSQSRRPLLWLPLPAGLSEAAVDAVKQWNFKAATLNGEAVDVIFNLTVNFKLDKPPDPEPH